MHFLMLAIPEGFQLRPPAGGARVDFWAARYR